MPIDLTRTDLIGDGVIDLTGLAAIASLTIHVTAQGPLVRLPSSDVEYVIGVGYVEFGFSAAAPWSADYYLPVPFWINSVHSWFDASQYPTIHNGGWDKLRYHISPGSKIDLWLSH